MNIILDDNSLRLLNDTITNLYRSVSDRIPTKKRLQIFELVDFRKDIELARRVNASIEIPMDKYKEWNENIIKARSIVMEHR
ncbi:hypothetical protein VPHD479_0096 [Vibrio phage D479]